MVDMPIPQMAFSADVPLPSDQVYIAAICDGHGILGDKVMNLCGLNCSNIVGPT